MARVTIDTGTITLTNGSDSVVGVGTNVLTRGIKGGDFLLLKTTGQPALVKSVESNLGFTLTAPWSYPTISDATFDILPLADLSIVTQNQQKLFDLMETLEAGIFSDSGSPITHAVKVTQAEYENLPAPLEGVMYATKG